ncbi:MAG: DUF255 domain-containing protein [Actinomycetota bacterium]|nr:DUF255 domain-containing protein [Actinomycetota bacterium]MDD5665753.1 DUF255 domain-containing protein [Actinomycetota bacterium]
MDENQAEIGEEDAAGGEFRFSPRGNLAHEINWHTWGSRAFQRAESEGKPVLLSISAVWCHWCHVMDETSYSDRAVIDLINRKFVPVRVDSDRNPDINRRYNQGGWPTTAFLDAKGTLLAGATYIPPEAMRAALERISDLYAKHEIDIVEPDQDFFLPTAKGGGLDLGIVEESGAQILRAWDRAHGGLGREPKFPQTEALELALELYADEGNREHLVFARTSLEAMIGSNLLDKVEGGFFRYSTTRDWSIPHYEKMLSDNAGLVSVLLKAYNVTGAEIFRRTALETAGFIIGKLSDGVSRLYGSQDADERYYLLGAAERAALTPPPVDMTVYTDLAARAAASLLVVGTALGRPEHARLALSSLDFLWSESYRPGQGMAHYHDGEAHRWGLLNDSVEAAAAFLYAYAYGGDRRQLERAETLLRLVMDLHWDGERSLFLDTARTGSLPALRPIPAEPGPQARAAEAMLLYSSLGGDEEWRERAGAVLSAAAGMVAAYGFMAADLARVVNLYLRGQVVVKIGGEPGATAHSLLRVAALSPQARTIPMVCGKMGRIEGEVWAEVCTARACRLRTSDPEVLSGDLGVIVRTGKEGG